MNEGHHDCDALVRAAVKEELIAIFAPHGFVIEGKYIDWAAILEPAVAKKRNKDRDKAMLMLMWGAFFSGGVGLVVAVVRYYIGI